MCVLQSAPAHKSWIPQLVRTFRSSANSDPILWGRTVPKQRNLLLWCKYLWRRGYRSGVLCPRRTIAFLERCLLDLVAKRRVELVLRRTAAHLIAHKSIGSARDRPIE